MMQQADDEESQKATAYHKNTGECVFDISKHGTQLKPVAFLSRSCNDMEIKYHYLTRKVVAGIWATGQNCQFLWGFFFYWICDCSALKEHIEYDGCIFMVQRPAQEFPGYTFFAVHIPNLMMCDVNAFSR